MNSLIHKGSIIFLTSSTLLLSSCSFLFPNHTASASRSQNQQNLHQSYYNGHLQQMNHQNAYFASNFLQQTDTSHSQVPTYQSSKSPTLLGYHTQTYQTLTASTYATPVQKSLNHAYGRNPAIASRWSRLKEAEQSLIQAKAAGLPQIDLSGSIGYTSRSTASSVDTIDSFTNKREIASLSAGLSQSLFDGGNIKHQKKKANASIFIAGQDLRSTESSVAQEIITSHLEIIRDQNVWNVQKRSVDILLAQKETTDLLVEYGESSGADAALVNARLKTSQIEANEALLKLEASRLSYQYLTGIKAENLTPPQVPKLPASVEEAIEIANRQNPNLLKAYAERDIAYSDLKIAKSGTLPKLSLDGSVSESMGQTDLVSSSSAATVTLNLRMPISFGGANKSRVKEAAYALSRKQTDATQTIYDIHRTINLSWNQLKNAAYAITLRREEIESNSIAFQSVQEQFNSGFLSQSELLLAERDFLEAQLRFESAKFEEDKLRLDLLNLLGMLDRHQLETNASAFNTNLRPKFSFKHQRHPRKPYKSKTPQRYKRY